MVPRVFSVVARVLYAITRCKGYLVYTHTCIILNNTNKMSVSLNLTIPVENDRKRLWRQTEDGTKFIERHCIFL